MPQVVKAQVPNQPDNYQHRAQQNNFPAGRGLLRYGLRRSVHGATGANFGSTIALATAGASCRLHKSIGAGTVQRKKGYTFNHLDLNGFQENQWDNKMERSLQAMFKRDRLALTRNRACASPCSSSLHPI